MREYCHGAVATEHSIQPGWFCCLAQAVWLSPGSVVPPSPSDLYTQAANLAKNYLEWRVLFWRENSEVGTHRDLLQKKVLFPLSIIQRLFFQFWGVFFLFKCLWTLHHISLRCAVQPGFFKPCFQPFSSATFILPLPWAVWAPSATTPSGIPVLPHLPAALGSLRLLLWKIYKWLTNNLCRIFSKHDGFFYSQS